MNEAIRKAIEHMSGFGRDHSDEAVAAARAIGAMGVEALCEALLTPEALNVPAGRHALKDEIARQDPAAVAPALLKALAHKDWRPNQVACDVIELMKEAMAPRLVEFLREQGPPHGRINAILILQRMGVNDAGPVLVRLATDDPEPEVRAAAVEALGYLASDGATEAVAEALRDESGEVRLKAIRAAGWLRASEAVDGILAFLDHADAEGRAAAVYALDRIGETRATARVVELLRDPEPYVCWSAAVALRRLWNDTCRHPLEVALKDDEETVAVSALETLCIAAPQSDDLRRTAANDARASFRRTAAFYAARRY
jgi:HEAT repeat protein